MSCARSASGLRRARRALLLACLLLAMAPRHAHAVSPLAEALFEEGRRLLVAGRTDEACLKFAESLAQDVSSGTLLNLALCHETQGKLATAWAEYRAASRLARSQNRIDRAEAAEARALRLEPKLPRLTLAVQRSLPGQSVLIDEFALGEGALGVAVPIDPGAHRITASAPGHRTWTTTVLIESAEQRTLDLPTLEPEAAAALAPLPAAMEPPSSAPIVGWIVGGAGVAGLAVGTAFGLSSLASYREADEQCPSHLQCNDAAIAERRQAQSKAWGATIAFGVGLAAAATGAYLILSSAPTAPREKVHTAQPRNHAAGTWLILRATPIRDGGWLGISSAF